MIIACDLWFYTEPPFDFLDTKGALLSQWFRKDTHTEPVFTFPVFCVEVIKIGIIIHEKKD